MRMLYQFSERDTFLHRLDPRAKLLISLAVVLISFALPSARSLAALCMLVVLYGLAAGLAPWHYRNVVVLLIPFSIAITIIQVLVQVPNGGTLLADLAGVPIYAEGLERGLTISLRALILGISFALFMMLTHPMDLTQAAVRTGLPFRYAYMIGFSLRFLPLFVEEFVKIRQAQASRGLDENRYGPATKVVSLPALLFPLIMDATRRSNSIALALEMRGLSTASVYGRTFLKDLQTGPRDYAVSALAILAVVGVVLARLAGAFA